jgi:hypothetical protein
MTKKPANRHALPKVIISEVDSEKILEFKIKYEKLARLDRVEVKAMHYEGKSIVFDEVVVNGGLIDVEYQDDHKTLFVKVGEKSYSIRGQKVGGKQRLREERVSQVKVQLELTDGSSERVSRTERELIVADNIKLYSQIVGREVKTTKEIYLAKRFLGYRSDLLFYYGFVDNFFKVAGNEKELWKIDFEASESSQLLAYIPYMVNDNLKNNDAYLKDYIANEEQIKSDLKKVQTIFSELRHALLHFNYDFFEKLFNGEDVGFDFDIEFLNLLIANIDKLNIDAKKEFITDEKIKLFGENLSLAKVYKLYSDICVNRVGFNKFINSMLIKDGLENQALKSEFDRKQGHKAYYIDIHSNEEYKRLYNRHKALVIKVSTLRDGQKIRKGNAEISEFKKQMNSMTTKNSLSHLEHKMRLAFGFMYGEYNHYNAFKNGFDTDVKNRKFDETDVSKSKAYFLSTYERQKPRTREKLERVAKDIESLKLETLIAHDPLLKFILLMFAFMPREIKGEFLGFVKKYYHDVHSIEEDIKEQELDVVESMSTSLKLKNLGRNIRSLTLFKYALSAKVNYNGSDESFYEEGNRYGKIYKKLGISHNQEEFDKTLVVPLFRYYSALFKLMNDFEIYSLAKANPTALNLQMLVDDETSPYKQGNYYNFNKMLREVHGVTNDEIKNGQAVFMRNKIAHFDTEVLLSKPLLGQTKMNLQRKIIIEFIKARGEMREILGYDAINDFRMKVVHLRTKMKVYSDKLQTMMDLLRSAKTPNDFYNVYKVKGVESINKQLLEVLAETAEERSIEKQICEGNMKYNS